MLTVVEGALSIKEEVKQIVSIKFLCCVIMFYITLYLVTQMAWNDYMYIMFKYDMFNIYEMIFMAVWLVGGICRWIDFIRGEQKNQFTGPG